MSTTSFMLSREQAGAWIAPARLSHFLDAVQGEHRRAVALYVWHARLSSVCGEVIHHVEVLVRNAIHQRLKAGQAENGLHSWLVDPEVLKPAELTAVTNVVTRVRRRRRRVTDDRVIAGLPLSFWSRMVGTGYEDLWMTRLHPAFPHSSGLRRDVAGPLNRIAYLRNDIAHHKSLLDVPVADRHADMLALAAAVDPAAAEWIAGISQVDEALSQAPLGGELV
jgi:hypothetical protein